MQTLFSNWKTSSAGLIMIAGSTVHMIFAFLNHTADETTVTRSLIEIIGGIGLIFAGDASQGQKRVADLADKAALAIESGDTAHLRNPTPPVKP